MRDLLGMRRALAVRYIGLTSLFCKSFPLQPFFFFFRTDYMIPQTFTATSEHIRFYFSVFFLFYTFSRRFRAVDYVDSCRLSSAR